MIAEDKVKLFGFSHPALERELDKVEAALNLDLGRDELDDKDEDYYPQFAQALRTEAADMGEQSISPSSLWPSMIGIYAQKTFRLMRCCASFRARMPACEWLGEAA